MRPRFASAAPVVAGADRADDALDLGRRKVEQDALDLLNEQLGVLERVRYRALHLDRELDRVAIFEEDELHRCSECPGGHGRGHDDRYRDVPVAHCLGNESAVDETDLAEPGRVATGLLGLRGRPAEVGEVRRQDDQRLDQRDGEAGDRDDGDDLEELAHVALCQRQRREGGDRRGDAGDHRNGYLAGADDRCLFGFETALHVAVRVLGDDDRVVDQDSENQNEGEEREEVEGSARDIEDDQPPGDRQRQAEGGERRDPRVEEEIDYEENQRQPPDAALVHRAEPDRNLPRAVVKQHELDAFGHERLCLLGDRADFFDDPDRVALATLEDMQRDRRLAVGAGRGRCLLECRRDPAQVGNADELTAVVHTDGDRLDVLGLRRRAGRSQQDLALIGP